MPHFEGYKKRHLILEPFTDKGFRGFPLKELESLDKGGYHPSCTHPKTIPWVPHRDPLKTQSHEFQPMSSLTGLSMGATFGVTTMTSLHAMLKMAERNKTLPCPVNGCTSKRTGVSPFCSSHRKRKIRYGDVHGRPINKSEYQKELLEVREFFIKHEGHPALNSGVYFFQSWMIKAAAGDASVGLKTMGKLYREGIGAREMLEEVVAIWIYALRKPTAIPDDLRLTYTLARNLIRMGKFNSKTSSGGNNYTQSPNPNELKAVGEYLRHSLARFVLNVHHALKAEHEAETSIKENLSLPFDQ